MVFNFVRFGYALNKFDHKFINLLIIALNRGRNINFKPTKCKKKK